MNNITYFAQEAAASGGLGALGLNVQSFVFQLITFLLVLIILRKFVYGKLVDTLEKRRQAVIDSLQAAEQSAKDLEQAEEKVAKLLDEARQEARGIVEIAHKEATSMIEDAETKAAKKAEHLIAQAESRMENEVAAAREQLRRDTAELVALATEKVLGEKIDAKKDAKLIETAIKEAK
jgi:F-type H+-transporting ATPase subunit b